MDELTHNIEIIISGNYQNGPKHHATISISGSGDCDHMLEAFRAALIASGYPIDEVKNLIFKLDD